jgi:hypothetical protein
MSSPPDDDGDDYNNNNDDDDDLITALAATTLHPTGATSQALHNPLILHAIFTHIWNSPSSGRLGTLVRCLGVCRVWYDEAVPFLWADPVAFFGVDRGWDLAWRLRGVVGRARRRFYAGLVVRGCLVGGWGEGDEGRRMREMRGERMKGTMERHCQTCLSLD